MYYFCKYSSTQRVLFFPRSPDKDPFSVVTNTLRSLRSFPKWVWLGAPHLVDLAADDAARHVL